MKKAILIFLVMSLLISLSGCFMSGAPTGRNDYNQGSDSLDIQAVTGVVQQFGRNLKMVPLLASQDVLKQSIQESYGDLVSPELLSKWTGDTQSAPGRMVSSPWPESIEVTSIEKLQVDTYEVKGEIIEITSEEQAKGGFAAKRPITMTVRKYDSKWFIDEVSIGDYIDTATIVYENAEFGFSFALPKSWENYSIVDSKWEGVSIQAKNSGKIVETGRIVIIRHPEWTRSAPRQDIPIMVFTLVQWESLQNEEFSIGAAPVGPSELGRNTRFVFALPARYNYSFPIGFEEVEDIIRSSPLHPAE